MQIDYKKIIAYATIFEMNLLTFFLFNFSKKNLIFLIFFFFFHSVISGVFFFIVDLLFKIYNTRIINGIASLNKNNLTLSYLFFFFSAIITGFPLTLKFVLEFVLLNKFFFFDFFLFILIIISIYIFNLIFLLRILKGYFGHVTILNLNYNIAKKDLLILINLFIFLILIPFIF